MAADDAIKALSPQALKMVKNNHVIGLGSGRAATAIVKLLSAHLKKSSFSVKAVPTSLQIKMEAEKGGIPIIEPDQIDHVDLVFDGADQIDAKGNMIKGGGGALLREKILISMAKKTVIIADETKFVKTLDRSVPVEVHPFARNTAAIKIRKLGGRPHIRLLDRGYPFVTENGNIILDCEFGKISDPKSLATKIIEIPGVMEVGIFSKPDVIYKAKENGKFEIL
ncbi:MAG: ribose-5-phosphate isomerase RpiA [Thaumarchaeota archaeon]|nr:ribose-5-phosphate isomerase RpiA [Nitrososphaerota archaeon]